MRRITSQRPAAVSQKRQHTRSRGRCLCHLLLLLGLPHMCPEPCEGQATEFKVTAATSAYLYLNYLLPYPSEPYLSLNIMLSACLMYPRIF